MKKLRITDLQKMAEQGEKITMLTCYDAGFAKMMALAGVESILVGDSLGMVVQGENSTLPVNLAAMIYHTQNVVRGNQTAFIVTDLPFGSYEAGGEVAFQSAVELIKAGAEMVKIEGDADFAPITEFLVKRSIPVCAHIGLLPQEVNTLGGYRVQGRDESAAERLIQDAIAHEKAGAGMLVIECVPSDVAKRVTEAVKIPVIGIGAGADTDGQVLVMHDMLGVKGDVSPKFVKDFLSCERNQKGSIEGAFASYVDAVKMGTFPAKEHEF